MEEAWETKGHKFMHVCRNLVYTHICECTHIQMHSSLSTEKILQTLVVSELVIQVNLILLVSFTIFFFIIVD